MSAPMQTERAATEVTTPLGGTQRASAASEMKDSTVRPEKEPLWQRVNRMLEDMRAVHDELSRYRVAQALDDTTEMDPCRRGCGRPAAYNGECFTCQREVWS